MDPVQDTVSVAHSHSARLMSLNQSHVTHLTDEVDTLH